jgi:phage shock protein A
LRQRLTDLEAAVQKSYMQKQVLIAGYKAAQATAKANAIMAKMDHSGAISIIERMEQRVAEREAAAAAAAEVSDTVSAAAAETQPDYQQLLLKAVAALERATTVIERMEKLLVASENPIP